MKKLIKGVGILFCVLLVFTVIFGGKEELDSERPKANKPEKVIGHEIVKIIPYDAPVKTQLEYQVLLKQKASQKELRELLEYLYEQASNKGGFEYHEGKATHIFIYVYPTAEYSNDQWIGMMNKVGEDSKAEYKLKESFITPAKEKVNKSKAEDKMSIFKELFLVEWRATALAEKEFPVAKPNSPDYDKAAAMTMLDKQIDKQRALLLEYREAIAKQYGITLDDLSEIAMEGFENNWPQPKRP